MPSGIGARIFNNSDNWPALPPWWCISTPVVAALLNLNPLTLIKWILSKGPRFIPTIHLRRAQGNSYFYRFYEIRRWAAQCIGIEYPIEQQIRDFLGVHMPGGSQGGDLANQTKGFDFFLTKDRKLIQKGEEPQWLDRDLVLSLDQYFCRQPTWLSEKKRYALLGDQ